jgi:hypothetical protein
MRKKITICGFVIAITLIALAKAVSASDIESLEAYVAQFRVFVNGEEQNFENPIVTINNRTYIPLREIGEVLGMNVEWDEENRKTIINHFLMWKPFDNNSVWDTVYRLEENISIAIITAVFAINAEPLVVYTAQSEVFVNGEERNLENPILIINDRTYIPLREISEILGMSVEWDGENRKIIINSLLPSLSHDNNSERDTLYRFQQNDLWGFADVYGNIIIEPQYYGANPFSEGLSFVIGTEDRPDKTGFIDLTGTLVIPHFATEAGIFSDGFAYVSVQEWVWRENYLRSTEPRGPFIFINREGQNVFGQEFTNVRNFKDGFAIVSHPEYGRIFIDTTGANVFNMSFREIRDFEDGYAMVMLQDGTRMHIDTSGNIVDKGGW